MLKGFFPPFLFIFLLKKQHLPEVGSEAEGQLCSKCESHELSTEPQPFMLFSDIC